MKRAWQGCRNACTLVHAKTLMASVTSMMREATMMRMEASTPELKAAVQDRRFTRCLVVAEEFMALVVMEPAAPMMIMVVMVMRSVPAAKHINKDTSIGSSFARAPVHAELLLARIVHGQGATHHRLQKSEEAHKDNSRHHRCALRSTRSNTLVTSRFLTR
eukprot:TRINITY_DN2069_c0_g1_i10.p1 TRINITY_DN2069_c0_g1~~TRINITY_DN2069_c0_g1_i10.p1  ORF type:complete len:180 (-),score=22.77 TRINITY_DN2069_c0_g1_i10:38-520(-)